MDQAWKYVVVDSMGLEVPIIFPNLLDHDAVCHGRKVISAGFVYLDTDGDSNIVAKCYGKSTNLGKECRPEEDDALITRALNR